METKSGRIIFLSNQPQHFEIVQNAQKQLYEVFNNRHVEVYYNHQHSQVDDHQGDTSEGWHPCPITVMGESLQPAKPLD